VATDLGIDEAVDGLDPDRGLALAPGSSGDLFGRPAAGELVQHNLAQADIAIELAAAPAPRLCLLLGEGRPVARPAIALQLPSNRRWRAIQSCSDLPDRPPFGR
jgi:hypothetical protein